MDPQVDGDVPHAPVVDGPVRLPHAIGPGGGADVLVHEGLQVPPGALEGRRGGRCTRPGRPWAGRPRSRRSRNGGAWPCRRGPRRRCPRGRARRRRPGRLRPRRLRRSRIRAARGRGVGSGQSARGQSTQTATATTAAHRATTVHVLPGERGCFDIVTQSAKKSACGGLGFCYSYRRTNPRGYSSAGRAHDWQS